MENEGEDTTDNLLGILLTEEEDEEVAEGEERTHHDDYYNCYLRSRDSTLSIRQLPSQGLSFQLWPAASTLVSLLDNCQQRESPLFPLLISSSFSSHTIRILELGSGTGLVGIAASSILGAHATLTDLPHVLPNLQFNIQANNANANVHCLRWGHPEDVESILQQFPQFHLILASDVVYHQHLFDPLLRTLSSLLQQLPQAIFLMAHLRRWSKDSLFFNKARKLFHLNTLHTDPPLPGSRTGVAVYHFAAKPRKDNHPLSISSS
ncbi:uncharacterized protein LOC143875612 [Tasmannia lanceolata]|uniref:uncharacterized protein LOC143875612 n=1 Tax=Tasmannia lanceolata TaxID=3420 RepID=UPI004063A040